MKKKDSLKDGEHDGNRSVHGRQVGHSRREIRRLGSPRGTGMEVVEHVCDISVAREACGEHWPRLPGNCRCLINAQFCVEAKMHLSVFRHMTCKNIP